MKTNSAKLVTIIMAFGMLLHSGCIEAIATKSEGKGFFSVEFRNAVTQELLPDKQLTIMGCGSCDGCNIYKQFNTDANGQMVGLVPKIVTCNSCCEATTYVIGADDDSTYHIKPSAAIDTGMNILTVLALPKNILQVRIKHNADSYLSDKPFLGIDTREFINVKFTEPDFFANDQTILSNIIIPDSPNLDTVVTLVGRAGTNININLWNTDSSGDINSALDPKALFIPMPITATHSVIFEY